MIFVVAGLIFDREGQLLVAQRPPGKAMAGFWEFPGGKIEHGEDPEQALRRELKEELALSISDLTYWGESLYRYDFATIHLLAYCARAEQTEVRLLEHTQVQWLAPAKISLRTLAPADHPFLHWLLAAGPSLSVK